MALQRTLRPVTGYLFVATHVLMQWAMWVDEGYFDFRWMKDPWNWVIYFIYTTLLFGIEWLYYRFIFRDRLGWIFATVLSFLAGVLTMMILLWSIFSAWR